MSIIPSNAPINRIPPKEYLNWIPPEMDWNLLPIYREYHDWEIPELRNNWFHNYADIIEPQPLRLPPLREINHRINLIDPNKKYKSFKPRCPEALLPEFAEKLEKYTSAGCWIAAASDQAAPMLCIPKKNGKLRTVVDTRQRNDNTIKDLTPLPDQDQIRNLVARSQYRSHMDLLMGFEQVRIHPDDVHKTAMTTVLGTFVSNIMMMGDCNAPATFQRLMNHIFRGQIGKCMGVYIDDVYSATHTIYEQELALSIIFFLLRKNQLLLTKEKVFLYEKAVNCLGHLVDDQGIHMDQDKMSLIRNWPRPVSYHDIEKFLGLVQYLAPYCPDLSKFTSPLSGIQRSNKPFLWNPIHEECFNKIKELICKAGVLKPVDPGSKEPIWLITDASMSGVGGYYGQGPSWETCRPAGFFSKKFTSAQMSYHTREQETLAILEGASKWEDKLIGRKVNVICDHESIGYIFTQPKLTNRLIRWSEYLSRFDFNYIYVKGISNKIADALSRWWDLGKQDSKEILTPERASDAHNSHFESKNATQSKELLKQATSSHKHNRAKAASFLLANPKTLAPRVKINSTIGIQTIDNEFVTIDSKLDPEGEELPRDHNHLFQNKFKSHKSDSSVQHCASEIRLADLSNQTTISGHKRPTSEIRLADLSHPNTDIVNEPRISAKGRLKILRPTTSQLKKNISKTNKPVMREHNRNKGSSSPILQSVDETTINLKSKIEGIDFLEYIQKASKLDNLLSKILDKPNEHPRFEVHDSLVFTRNKHGNTVLCIPTIIYKDKRVTGQVIDQAHNIIGHKGTQKTLEYIRLFYWWSTLTKDVDTFCRSCGICQTTKSQGPLVPAGLLHTLPIPQKPWESIGMDFVGPFPESHGFDYILVVICRLTSMVHLIATNTNVTAAGVAVLFIREIVRLHGLPQSIVSDRDPKFTSQFWTELHKTIGIKLLLSTAFHPQTDGATERSIRGLSQVLRSCVNADQTNWFDRLPLVEFAINSTISSSTGFTPFELNYGYLPTMLHHPKYTTPYLGVRQYANQAILNICSAHDSIIAARVRQTEQSNRNRRKDPEIAIGSKVYLSTDKLNLPKKRATKLLPKYIGPYTVSDVDPNTSTYIIELPPELKERRIHPKFHISRLRPHIPNNDELFPHRDVEYFYDFGSPEDQEWHVDEILGHEWINSKLYFYVKWSAGDITREPLKNVNELVHLDHYLELKGVETPSKLSKETRPVA